MGKVPDTGSGSNDELSTTNNEGADPEESEQVVNPNVSGRIIPFNLAKRVNIPNTEHIYGRNDPESEPCSNNKEENHGNKENAESVLYEI